MTLAEAKKIYENNGGKFFTKDTMEFWGTKVESGLYSNRCFITSDNDFSGEHRYYNVRQFSEDYTKTRTVSEFNKLTTKEQAVALVHNPDDWVDSAF